MSKVIRHIITFIYTYFSAYFDCRAHSRTFGCDWHFQANFIESIYSKCRFSARLVVVVCCCFFFFFLFFFCFMLRNHHNFFLSVFLFYFVLFLYNMLWSFNKNQVGSSSSSIYHIQFGVLSSKHAHTRVKAQMFDCRKIAIFLYISLAN